MKILIVDDDQAALEFMEDSIEALGHSVRVASNGATGLEAFKNFEPHLVISDVRMPEMDGLQMLRNIRIQDPGASVVMTTAYGCEDYAVAALRLGAEEYLTKPIRSADLFHLIAKHDKRRREDDRDLAARAMVSERRLRMEIDNQMGFLSSVASQLVSEADGMFGKRTEASLYLGLYELLSNAVEHGNLEISFEERKQALRDSSNGMNDLLGTRLMNSELANRMVTIESVIDRTGCEWTITDEGKGFDWQAYLQAIEGTYPTHSEQRGILLNQMRFDELEYMGVGNAVRVKKYSKSESPSRIFPRN